MSILFYYHCVCFVPESSKMYGRHGHSRPIRVNFFYLRSGQTPNFTQHGEVKYLSICINEKNLMVSELRIYHVFGSYSKKRIPHSMVSVPSMNLIVRLPRLDLNLAATIHTCFDRFQVTQKQCPILPIR